MTPALILLAITLVSMSGVVGMGFGRGSRNGERVTTALMIVGSLVGLWVAFDAVHASESIAIGWAVPGGALAVGVDRLSAVFLAPLFVVAPLGSIYGLEYWSQHQHPGSGRNLRLFYGLATAGIALLVVARNAVLFLMGWETMALAAFFCITAEDEDEAVRRSGYVYVVATRISALLLVAMFAELHAATGTWDFATPAHPIPASTATAVFVLAVLGFGLKAGLMPFHVWLPGAHANAPSHVSALMSGVLIKTGIYGIIRVCSFFDHPPIAWGIVLLLGGSASGVLGVAFAIGQHDLKRLLAYHSVENIGIITMGVGVAMLGRSVGSPVLVTLGLAGALLHVWNHALFKTLLFLSAGSVLHATGTREIDKLGGLSRRMPRTAFAFLFGAIAICGLPPLNGFVSELLVYLGLFRTLTEQRLWAFGALGVPALALIGAMALACFAKAYGAVFLGHARSEKVSGASEPGLAMLAPLVALGLACGFIGLAPSAVAPLMQRAAAVWAPEFTGTAPPLESLAPLVMLSIAGAGLLVLAAGAAAFLGRVFGREQSAAGLTWDCAYAAPSRRMQYTSSSFAEALVGFFSWALRPNVHFDAPAGLFPSRASFHTHIADTVLDRAVLPLTQTGARTLRWFRWVQHGNLQLYLVYVFATLLFLILLGR